MNRYNVIVSALTESVDKCIRIVEGTDIIPIRIRVKDYTIPDGASALVYAKARGVVAKVQTATIDGNAIEFTPEKGFFTEGENVMQGRITKDGRDLVTFAITVVCTRSIVTDDAEEMNSDPTLLQQLLSEIEVISARTSVLASLEEGSTTGDAELMDGRTDYKGNTHVNIGEHIREVTSQLSEEIVDVNSVRTLYEPENVFDKQYSGTENIDALIINYSNGYAENYEITAKGVIQTFAGRYISYPIEVKGGKTIYFFWGSVVNSYNMFFVNCYDEDMNFIERNPSSGITNYTLPINTKYVRLLIQDASWFTNKYAMITYTDVIGTTYRPYFKPFYLLNDGVANVLSMGAKGDGVTDDSDIIQLAVNMFRNVYLPSTQNGYMISKPIEINYHSQKLYGDSHMPYYANLDESNNHRGSVIRPTRDFEGNGMIIIDHFAYGVNISKISLMWNSAFPDIETNGIVIAYTSDLSVSSLGYHILKDIFIYKLNGDGIVSYYKDWDGHYENVHVKNCSGNGFTLNCTDSKFVGCLASDNRKNGFQINKGACVFDSCKAFCNGTIGDTDTAGFVINGLHTRIIGCNSQQNYTNGIIINSNTNVISGLVLDGNGWKNPTNYLSALKINKSGNILDSIMIIPHWLSGCVKYGIDISEDITNINLSASIVEAWDDWTTVKDSDGNLVFADFEKFVDLSPTTKTAGNRIVLNCELLE